MIEVYEVRLSHDRAITGFHYPPNAETYTPEKNEIQFYPLGFAIIGDKRPYHWMSKDAALHVAKLIGGYIETHQKEFGYETNWP